MNSALRAALLSVFVLSGCATVPSEPAKVSVPLAPVSGTPQPQTSAPVLKRKIAIGRFSNSTRYGKSLLLPGEADPIANQAADMLMARLVETNRFIVVERDNLDQVGIQSSKDLAGFDALIIGSVTEFGRKTEGQVGFLSGTKKQTAKATVEARLVDAKTAVAFFSGAGSGEATSETGEIAGFGGRADYDATLNDRAISTAISDLTNTLVQKLEARRWTTDVLQVRGSQVLISGGSAQGLKIGDQLNVEKRGETLTSGQTGLPITLPGQKVATIQITSFFGEGEFGEGSTASIVSGDLSGAPADQLTVYHAGAHQ